MIVLVLNVLLVSIKIFATVNAIPLPVQNITAPSDLGEGPHWDDRHQALFFVSLVENTINKYDYETGEHTKTQIGGNPGFIVPVDGTMDQYVMGVDNKLIVIQWDGVEGSKAEIIKELAEVDNDGQEIDTIFNDGKADPRGRLFAGTMANSEPTEEFPMNKGSMYRFDSRGFAKIGDPISLANGLAWDLEEKAFYYIDSLEYNIRRYDYDVETGEISNKQYIFDFKENNIEGFPDGMTIDTDGNLWVAVFNGYSVIKIDPKSGTLLQEVIIPAKQVASVTFGGPNMDVLFVTTGSIYDDGEQKPPAGSTFMVTGLGVTGTPNVNFKLN